MYTRNSAFMANDDDKRGTLEPGKFADLAVLSADYLTAPVKEIGKIRSVLTMVGGKVVYAAAPFAKLARGERIGTVIRAACEHRSDGPLRASHLRGGHATHLETTLNAQRHRAERLQQMLVELVAHLFHLESLGVRERQPVGALLHQRGIDIHDRGQAHDIADLLAAQAVGIAGAIEELMMVQDHIEHFRRKTALGRKRIIAAARMLAHLIHFFGRQRPHHATENVELAVGQVLAVARLGVEVGGPPPFGGAFQPPLRRVGRGLVDRALLAHLDQARVLPSDHGTSVGCGFSSHRRAARSCFAATAPRGGRGRCRGAHSVAVTSNWWSCVFWPGLTTHGALRVPRNVSEPSDRRGVRVSSASPRPVLAAPALAKVIGASVPVAVTSKMPVPTGLFGMVSVEVRFWAVPCVVDGDGGGQASFDGGGAEPVQHVGGLLGDRGDDLGGGFGGGLADHGRVGEALRGDLRRHVLRADKHERAGVGEGQLGVRRLAGARRRQAQRRRTSRAALRRSTAYRAIGQCDGRSGLPVRDRLRRLPGRSPGSAGRPPIGGRGPSR